MFRFVAVCLRAHNTDEAKALARDGANQLLVPAAVADRLSRGVDAAGQGRIRDDTAAPDRGDQIVLADDAVAVLHQINQQVEYLGLDGNGIGTAAQLAAVDVKHMISKVKLHGRVRRRTDAFEPIIRNISRANQARIKVFPRRPRASSQPRINQWRQR